MASRSVMLCLADIVDAAERVSGIVGEIALADFETDWQKQWLVERGVEIISEASRRLPDELKARHPVIPWPKVAGIGNVLRHAYESIAAPVMLNLVRDHLPDLARVCRQELERERLSREVVGPDERTADPLHGTAGTS